MTEKLIAPSILAADIMNLKEDVQMADKAGADVFHIDIMDGHFVPNMSFSPEVVAGMKRVTDKPLDIHLMIDNPDEYIKDLVDAGADTIMIHAESSQHAYRSVELIKSYGVKSGIVINPGTPIEAVKWMFPILDQILVMTVNPGFGGQKFITSMANKVQKLDQLRQTSADANFLIEVDGGINDKTIVPCAEAGADIFVAGSYLYNGEPGFGDRLEGLRKIIAD